MKLDINDENQIKINETVLNDFEKEVDNDIEKNIGLTVLKDDYSKKSIDNNQTGVDRTINKVTKTLEENISKEIDNLKLDDSLFEKISKSSIMDVVKVSIEAVLKGVLKKKFGINFSTFNDMKDTVNEVMDGNLKDAIKNGTDIAIDELMELDGITKTTIKTIKNKVIDKTIDSEKYEIVNKQTKILNRISDNCFEFNEALKINDADTIKKRANSIKNDMEKILPIRETINQANCVLEKYSLWKNKGEQALTTEESELIEKLNLSA